MKSHTIIIELVSLALLAGCATKAGDLRIPVITQEDSYAEAADKVDVFIDEVWRPALGINPPFTQYADLPDDGTATYDGYIDGERNAFDVVPINYVANLQVTIDFATEDVVGVAYDFVTDLEGFETPEGDIEMAGRIRQDNEEVQIGFNGSGLLTGSSVDAEYRGGTAENTFLRGAEGQGICCEFDGFFDWSNPDWSESYSPGNYRVLQR